MVCQKLPLDHKEKSRPRGHYGLLKAIYDPTLVSLSDKLRNEVITGEKQ